MPARFNHTIIAAKNASESAAYYKRLLEAVDAPSWGVFTNVTIADDVLLQFAQPPIDFSPQHYAFLVTDRHFADAREWLADAGRDYWADPQRTRANEVSDEDGGQRLYTLDPAGHFLELLTKPYL